MDYINNFTYLIVKHTNAAWEKLQIEGYKIEDLEVWNPRYIDDPVFSYRVVVKEKISGKILYQEHFVAGTYEKLKQIEKEKSK